MSELKNKPNDKVLAEMVKIADEYEELAASYDKMAAVWRRVRDLSRAGDLVAVFDMAAEIMPANEEVASKLDLVRAHTLHLKHIDKAFFNEAYTQAGRVELMRICEGKSAEELQEMLAEHEEICDANPCDTGDLLREEIAKREAH